MAKLDRLPEVYVADELLQDWPTRGKVGVGWCLARPVSYQLRGPLAWWRRFKVAYRVFTGELDALKWSGQ